MFENIFLIRFGNKRSYLYHVLNQLTEYLFLGSVSFINGRLQLDVDNSSKNIKQIIISYNIKILNTLISFNLLKHIISQGLADLMPVINDKF